MHHTRVRIDIISSLKMKDPYVAIGSFDRKNLFYGVKQFNRSQSFVDELVQEISKIAASGSSTIIYCTTIKDVEQVFICFCLFPALLRNHFCAFFIRSGHKKIRF